MAFLQAREHPEHYDRQLHRYRYEIKFPKPAFVWDLGEALRACGVAWMRGTVLLYAYGLHRDLVGVYGSAGERLIPFKEWFQYEVAELPNLTGSSELDRLTTPSDEAYLPAFDRRHVHALYMKYEVQPPGATTLATKRHFWAFGRWRGRRSPIRRQKYVNVLNEAWRQWLADRNIALFSDELLDAYHIAVSNVPRNRRARLFAQHLKWWFDVLQTDLHGAPNKSRAKDDLFYAVTRESEALMKQGHRYRRSRF